MGLSTTLRYSCTAEHLLAILILIPALGRDHGYATFIAGVLSLKDTTFSGSDGVIDGRGGDVRPVV